MNWTLNTAAAISAIAALALPAVANAGDIGVNRAGSIAIESGEMQLLHDRDLTYRVDFRRDFSDAERDNIVTMAADVGGVNLIPVLLQERRPEGGDMSGWIDYVQHVVARYPQQRTWQIWNEPNFNAGSARHRHYSAAGWRAFVSGTADAIHAANPQAIVIAGGISADHRGWRDYMRVPASVDRTAVHTYASTAERALTKVRAANAISRQRMLVTEVGFSSVPKGAFSSTATSKDRQADDYRTFLRGWHGTTIAFLLRDSFAAPQWYGMGLHDAHGRAKPAWRVVSSASTQ